MGSPQDAKEAILDAIRNLYGDTSVSQAETKDMLEEIAEETSSLAEGLEE